MIVLIVMWTQGARSLLAFWPIPNSLSTLHMSSPFEPPLQPASERRQRVVAALKRFDVLAAMSLRGDAEGCQTALEELRDLDAAGLAFELGPNAHNRAMRVCAAESTIVEALYDELAASGQQDEASLQALASVRLENDMLMEAAVAVSALLEPALKTTISKSGRPLPLRRLPERTVRVARAVVEACTEAGLLADNQEGRRATAAAAAAEGGGHFRALASLWRRCGEAGLWAPPPPPPPLERTLALLKPDCVQAGVESEIEALIAEHGFHTVRRRRWRMDETEAADFLQTSWGSAAGDRQRRFFTEMVRMRQGRVVRRCWV